MDLGFFGDDPVGNGIWGQQKRRSSSTGARGVGFGRWQAAKAAKQHVDEFFASDFPQLVNEMLQYEHVVK